MYTMSRSPTAAIRAELIAWQQEQGWSRETLAQFVVESHEALGAERVTGIAFQRNGDVYRAMRSNGVRLFRWLDDDATNPAMPLDMLPSILHALPPPRRLRVVIAMLGDSCGLAIAPRAESCQQFDVLHLLADTAKETAEATQALVALAQAHTPENTGKALKELAEAEESIHSAREQIEAAAGGSH